VWHGASLYFYNLYFIISSIYTDIHFFTAGEIF